MHDASVDVLVVGGGLAGLHTSTALARAGHDVLLVERRMSLTRTIQTTGIFVRKTIDDFPLPVDYLGPPIRRVVLYPPSLQRPVTLLSDRDEYRVGDMAGIYRAASDVATQAGVRILLGTRYVGRFGQEYAIVGPDGPATIRARFLVGADGARSQVARDLLLDTNRHFIVGAEEIYSVGPNAAPPTFHCVVDPTLAPGYIAWVTNDGHHAHVGVAGDRTRFRDGPRGALARFIASAPGLAAADRTEPIERRGGPIPVGGVLRRISCPEGLLVGDAAGAVSPLTAGGLDPCLRLSVMAASVLDDALVSGRSDALRRYDGAQLRSRFKGRLAMRHGLTRLSSPTVATAAFSVLRNPLGRAAARRILFGDHSFPGSPPTQSG